MTNGEEANNAYGKDYLRQCRKFERQQEAERLERGSNNLNVACNPQWQRIWGNL